MGGLVRRTLVPFIRFPPPLRTSFKFSSSLVVVAAVRVSVCCGGCLLLPSSSLRAKAGVRTRVWWWWSVSCTGAMATLCGEG